MKATNNANGDDYFQSIDFFKKYSLEKYTLEKYTLENTLRTTLLANICAPTFGIAFSLFLSAADDKA